MLMKNLLLWHDYSGHLRELYNSSQSVALVLSCFVFCHLKGVFFQPKDNICGIIGYYLVFFIYFFSCFVYVLYFCIIFILQIGVL